MRASSSHPSSRSFRVGHRSGSEEVREASHFSTSHPGSPIFGKAGSNGHVSALSIPTVSASAGGYPSGGFELAQPNLPRESFAFGH